MLAGLVNSTMLENNYFPTYLVFCEPHLVFESETKPSLWSSSGKSNAIGLSHFLCVTIPPVLNCILDRLCPFRLGFIGFNPKRHFLEIIQSQEIPHRDVLRRLTVLLHQFGIVRKYWVVKRSSF